MYWALIESTGWKEDEIDVMPASRFWPNVVQAMKHPSAAQIARWQAGIGLEKKDGASVETISPGAAAAARRFLGIEG